MKINKAEFHLIRWMCWLICFIILSSYLMLYENVMQTTLFTEGLIGYGLLVGMGAFAFLWVRELFLLQKYLTVLNKTESGVIV
jgi:uncharacterized membrane protein (DUF485 family)